MLLLSLLSLLLLLLSLLLSRKVFIPSVVVVFIVMYTLSFLR